MKAWAEFLPDMTSRLPGCPEPFIEDAARDAAIYVLARTRAWKQRLVTLATTVANQADYTVTPPALAGLHHIHVAKRGTDELTVALPGQVDGELDLTAVPTDECLIEVLTGTSIRLTPPPAVAGEAIVATVSWVPLRTATGIEDALYAQDEIFEAIWQKGVAELMMQPGKPWSSSLSTNHRARCDQLVSDIANRVGPVRRTPLRVKQWG